MTSDVIGIIAAVTLSVLILGTMILPFLAGLYHITYEINQTIVTGAIAALSGIISAVAVKKLQNNPNCPSSDAIDTPSDAIQDRKPEQDADKQ